MLRGPSSSNSVTERENPSGTRAPATMSSRPNSAPKLSSVEPLEDVAHRGREPLNIDIKVLADVVLIAHQLAEVEFGSVVEALARSPKQERVGTQTHLLLRCELGEYLRLGWLKHTVQSPQDREWLDHFALVGLL